jgi:hypothetical protein
VQHFAAPAAACQQESPHLAGHSLREKQNKGGSTVGAPPSESQLKNPAKI